MPKIGNSADDPKVQKRIDMEKRVTRVMMGYISKTKPSMASAHRG